jgi:hypothetical protein
VAGFVNDNIADFPSWIIEECARDKFQLAPSTIRVVRSDTGGAPRAIKPKQGKRVHASRFHPMSSTAAAKSMTARTLGRRPCRDV